MFLERRVVGTKNVEIEGEWGLETTIEIKTSQKPIEWRSKHDVSKASYFIQIPFTEVARASFPKEPNPRETDISKKAYEPQKEYALNNPLFEFHSSPFVLIAHRVKIVDSGAVLVTFRHGFVLNPALNDGQLDGGHRRDIITFFIEQDKLSESDYRVINVNIITGFTDRNERAELGHNHNHGVNNTLSTKENNKGSYDIVKEALKNTFFAEKIAYKQNAKGVKVGSVIRSVVPFNVESFPKGSSPIHPNENSLVRHFAEHQEEYSKLMKILPEIIELSELICYGGFSLYSGVYGIRKNDDNLDTMSGQMRAKDTLTYKGIVGSAIKQDWGYFLLSTFRHLLILDSEGYYRWKISFEGVKEFVSNSLPELIEKIRKRNKKLRTFGMFAREESRIAKGKLSVKKLNRWEELRKFNKKLFEVWLTKSSKEKTSEDTSYLEEGHRSISRQPSVDNLSNMSV